jgi:hypothetical protein
MRGGLGDPTVFARESHRGTLPPYRNGLVVDRLYKIGGYSLRTVCQPSPRIYRTADVLGKRRQRTVPFPFDPKFKQQPVDIG